MTKFTKHWSVPESAMSMGKNWMCKYPCCLSQGIFVEKSSTKGVLQIRWSTCKKEKYYFFTICWFTICWFKTWGSNIQWGAPSWSSLIVANRSGVLSSIPADPRLDTPTWYFFWGWKSGRNRLISLLQLLKPRATFEHKGFWRPSASNCSS